MKKEEDCSICFIGIQICIVAVYCIILLVPMIKQQIKEIKYEITKIESSTQMPDSQNTMLPTAQPTPTTLQEELMKR